jgi:hypothetical protein
MQARFRQIHPRIPRRDLPGVFNTYFIAQAWYEAKLASCCEFIPALRASRLKCFVQGPRRVLANSDTTRPSFVTEHEPGYLSVFSGKVDHSVWLADEIAERWALPRHSLDLAGKPEPLGDTRPSSSRRNTDTIYASHAIGAVTAMGTAELGH